MQPAPMLPPYDFLAPRLIVFGWGRRREAGRLARSLGRRAFIIGGSSAVMEGAGYADIEASLAQSGVEPQVLAVAEREPQVADVDRLARLMREARAGTGDLVLGLGGGAAMDLAKAVAAMATNHQSDTVQDYLEGVGRNLRLEHEPLPVMAMPTTAGTGAEATKNAVISSYDPHFKKSLRDDRILPRIALIDPELTVSAGRTVTAASGMDAITQLIESFISRKARPIPQALALQGLKLAVSALREAVEHPDQQAAREAMSHAALLSGLSLANSGLGLAHGVAAALGVHCRVPHGAACALMLPAALRVNRAVCETELAALAQAAFGWDSSAAPAATVDRFIDEIERLCNDVGVPRRLGDVGVGREQIRALVTDSRGSSMSGNPRDLSDEELTALLEEML